MTVPRWTCPACKRHFGRANQSHGCAPALTVDDYYDKLDARLRPTFRRIHDALVAHLKKLGPVEVEAVSVGIMLRRSRTFAELRPRRDRLVLSFLLSRPLAHQRIAKTLQLSANRMAYFVDLRSVADIDRELRGWLTEAYATSPD